MEVEGWGAGTEGRLLSLLRRGGAATIPLGAESEALL